MKEVFKNLTYFVLPAFTLVIGIFLGIHYLDFQEKVLDFVDENALPYEDIISGENDDKDQKSDNKVVSGDYVLPVKSEIEISKAWNVWEVVREKFLIKEHVTSEDVLYGMIAGMVDSLGDDYTMFFNTEQSEDFDIEVNGELEGIGAELTFKKKVLLVIDVIKNAPAYKAGLMADDLIIGIDGEDPTELGFHPSISKIRGPKGTEVIITVLRPETGETIEIPIIRDKVDIQNVEWKKVSDDFAYIMVNRFTPDLEQELREAATEILAFDPDGIILDLRDNGGGYMDQAVVLADAFVDEGIIVYRRFSDDKVDTFYATSETIFNNYPLVVLINGNSASASEIVAGAIQDTKVGVLMGETSYGKGSVQEKFSIAGAALKITVANWYTPNDRNINDIGLTPDVEIEMTVEEYLEAKEKNEDIYLDEAVEYLKAL